MNHTLDAWLGPALNQLTAEQVERLEAEAEKIDARYPDPDEQPQRDAALSAAVQYLLGETTPADAGHALIAARRAEALAYTVSQQLATMANADGMSEVAAATATAIDRMTLRKALGKR